MAASVPVEDLKRLLEDSRSSTLTELDELSFIRMTIRCLTSGLTYEDALQMVYTQLYDQINGE